MLNRLPRGVLFAFFFGWTSTAIAFDLQGTLFEQAANRYSIDTKLLYAVALAESALRRGNQQVSPWFWTLRGLHAPFYAKTQQEAESTQAAFQQQFGQNIDIGVMQISLRWHGKAFNPPAVLLNPHTNIMLEANILHQALQSAPHDLELGVGRYHHWSNPVRARAYGQRVLTFYRNLNDL